jgi:hypothetical protein
VLPSFVASIPQKLGPEDISTMKTFGGRIRERVAQRRDEYRRLPKAAA